MLGDLNASSATVSAPGDRPLPECRRRGRQKEGRRTIQILLRRPWQATASLLLSILLLLACTSAAAPAEAATTATPAIEPSGFIGHEGRWLTDAEGRVLLPHGLNFGLKYPPFDLLKRFSAADAAALYASGFVTLRLGVQFQALMPQPGKIDGTYVDQIVQMVNLLATHHIHVLLDMHQDEYGPSVGVDGFPKWATQTGGAPNPKLPFPRGYFTSPAQQVVWANFWADKPGPGGVGLQERYIDGLVALAKALRSNQGLLGYTVMNEPWPGASYKTCEATTGCPALEQQLLDPFYTKVARAIRAVDPNHLIFVEPFLTFDYGGQTSLPAFASPDNALSVHPYLAQFPGQTGKAIALSTKNDDALLVTEFGATTNVTTIDNYMNGFDSEMVPWMFWQYTTIAPSSSASTNERQLAAAASMALTRPYPLAVAGTPTSYGFNEASRQFALRFTTQPVDGKPFARGTVTDVVIPKADYQNGYAVSATGATVTSARCASMLTLRATAPEVTVTVNPGGGC